MTRYLLKPPLLLVLAISFDNVSQSAPKLAVMETAFGDRVNVEHVELAKKAGYDGIQIITGDLDERGLLPLSYPSNIKAFKEASQTHGIEIVSLCAAALNKLPCWEEETKEKAISVGIQSIQACHALDVPILLVPFFNRAGFGNDSNDPKFKAVTRLLRRLSAEAEAYQLTLGIESRTLQPALDYILSDIGSAYLKIYYDTGNMLSEGENAYQAIEHWGPDGICQMHLKSFDSDRGVFGDGKTDLRRLAASIHNSKYDKWLVFESGPGKNRELGFDYAKENRVNIQKMFDQYGK